MQVHIHSGVHQRVVNAFQFFADDLGLSMGTHDDFVSVGIDVALAERDRLGENVEAGTNEVDKKDFVVFDEAEDAFVEVAGVLGAERNDDALRCVSLDYTLGHREREHVVFVSEELEAGGQIALVNNVEETVGGLLRLHLAEMHTLGRELDIVTICLSPAAEFNLIASESAHFEEAEALDSGDEGRVGDSYFCDLTRRELTLDLVHLDGDILPIIVHFLYRVLRGDEGRILQAEDLTGRLADEQVFEIETLLVERHEGVFADGAHLKHFGQLVATLVDVDHDGGDDHFGLLSAESDRYFFLLLGSQCA